jgi:polysaccharide biosynthesis protein PelG
MAGIGFRLQDLVAKGSYLEAATAYVSSAVITAGPWLSGVVALVVLNFSTSSYLHEADRSLLFATIVSTFAASLLIVGGPQLPVTRYLADRLYLKDTASVAPTCTGVLCMVIPFSIVASPFLMFAPFDIRYRFLVFTLFLTLSTTWMVMQFLSAARKYMRIVLILTGCYALGISASIFLGQLYGLLGSLAGFTFGQMTCLSLLIVSVYLEFPSVQTINFAYLRYIFKYWDLFIIGTLYTVGIWADTMVLWASSQGQVISGFYHLFPPYDTAKFVVSLSTVPAITIFMIHLETNFDRYCQDYYGLIDAKGTLRDLVRAREGMREAVRTGLGTIIKVQSIVALFLCLIAQDLAAFVGLTPTWVPLLRIEIVAWTAQFFVFVMMVLLLYIDQRRATLLVIAVFAICNIALTLVSVHLGDARFYGIGYLGASIIGAILGWFLLNDRLKRLEYLTFMAQPLGGS